MMWVRRVWVEVVEGWINCAGDWIMRQKIDD